MTDFVSNCETSSSSRSSCIIIFDHHLPIFLHYMTIKSGIFTIYNNIVKLIASEKSIYFGSR